MESSSNKAECVEILFWGTNLEEQRRHLLGFALRLVVRMPKEFQNNADDCLSPSQYSSLNCFDEWPSIQGYWWNHRHFFYTIEENEVTLRWQH